jgi:hypothetical protein
VHIACLMLQHKARALVDAAGLDPPPCNNPPAQVYDAVRREFQLRGAYFLNEEEKVKVRAKVIVDGKLNPNIVGQSVQKLAELFGITVPPGTKVIIGEVEKIGKDEALSEVRLCSTACCRR